MDEKSELNRLREKNLCSAEELREIVESAEHSSSSRERISTRSSVDYNESKRGNDSTYNSRKVGSTRAPKRNTTRESASRSITTTTSSSNKSKSRTPPPKIRETSMKANDPQEELIMSEVVSKVCIHVCIITIWNYNGTIYIVTSTR